MQPLGPYERDGRDLPAAQDEPPTLVETGLFVALCMPVVVVVAWVVVVFCLGLAGLLR
jgi:hypothetical protein